MNNRSKDDCVHIRLPTSTARSLKQWVAGAAVVAAVAGWCATSDQARADTFNIHEDTSTTPLSVITPPTSTTGTVHNVTGSVPFVYLSPYGDNVTQFTSIQSGGTATYDFLPTSKLSIFWGSPDFYNSMTFKENGVTVFTIHGDGLPLGNLLNQQGHDLVAFTDTSGVFNSVVLGTTDQAFEFSSLLAGSPTSSSTTPLPAALPLYAAGMGFMGLLGWRRKRKQNLAMAAA